MAGISYVLDDAAAKAAIQSIGRAVEHPQKLYAAFGGYLKFSTQRRFEAETGPDGTRWPRLSPRTANKRVGHKGRRGYEHMLRVTNLLYDSINYDAAASSVEWGSNVPYARVLNNGGAITIPARTGAVSLRRVRQKGGGIRSRFARPGSRGAVARQVAFGAHQITIPARPYLGVSPADEAALAATAADYLRGEVGR